MEVSVVIAFHHPLATTTTTVGKSRNNTPWSNHHQADATATTTTTTMTRGSRRGSLFPLPPFVVVTHKNRGTTALEASVLPSSSSSSSSSAAAAVSVSVDGAGGAADEALAANLTPSDAIVMDNGPSLSVDAVAVAVATGDGGTGTMAVATGGGGGVGGGTMDSAVYAFNKALIDNVYHGICLLYPVCGTDRDYARFYVLETVARVPYFAYLSVLHLKETFGVRYDTMSDRMRTHYAEADNELHHLLIMEELGGNADAVDRVVAQTAAFMYYWYVVVLYCLNEPAAYHLSELIEDHAYHTYDTFLSEHEDRLRTKPVPDIARKYYERDDPFLFDQFCTVKGGWQGEGTTPPVPSSSAGGGGDAVVVPTVLCSSSSSSSSRRQRRPKQLETLYDVFCNVRDDEKEHWKTLCNLVQFNDMNAVDAARVASTRPAAEAVASASPPPAAADATVTADAS